jgi:hypothetical protein
MGRLPFLNLTFVILVLTMMTVQRLAPRTQASEEDFTEFSQSVAEARSSYGLSDGGSTTGLAKSLVRVAHHFAQAWERAEILAEWRIENESADWEKAYASTIVEKKLIDARAHVENAEVYEWAIKNRQKTMAELNQAEHSLENARSLVKTPALATIDRVARELEFMKIDASDEQASRMGDYANIKMDLDRVIDWVRTTGLQSG